MELKERRALLPGEGQFRQEAWRKAMKGLSAYQAALACNRLENRPMGGFDWRGMKKKELEQEWIDGYLSRYSIEDLSRATDRLKG